MGKSNPITKKKLVRKPKPRSKKTASARDLVLKVFSIMASGETMKHACLKVGINPDTVHRWVSLDEEVKAGYAAAKRAFAEASVMALMDIADQEPDVQRARLKTDVIKWFACRTMPKEYGDKVQVDAAVSVKDQTDEQLSAKFHALLVASGLAKPDSGTAAGSDGLGGGKSAPG